MFSLMSVLFISYFGHAEAICQFPAGLSGFYDAKCVGTMVTPDGKTYDTPMDTLWMKQSPTDQCKFTIGAFLAYPEDQIPYFQVGEMNEIKFEDSTVKSFAFFDPSTGVLNGSRTFVNPNRTSLQVSKLVLENGIPKSYWEKTYAAANDHSDLSCEIIKKGN